MEQRVKKIGGEFFVKSTPGAGTKITFLVPVAAQAEPVSSVAQSPSAV
jgi:signal transduction histidine kinase